VSQETLAAVQGGPIQPDTPTPEVKVEHSPEVPAAMPQSQAEAALARVEQARAEEALHRASATLEEEGPNPLRIILVGATMVALG
ncbi:hypothetical protein ABTN49_19680, partial [Acinetobacter baumannii]